MNNIDELCFGKKRLLRIATALTLALVVSCGSSGKKKSGSSSEDLGCQSGQISVWGEAPIFTSLSASREKAKEDACRTAVEKCIGKEVAGVSEVADGQSITSEIFTQARGICRNAQLVDENQYKLDTVNMLRVFMRYQVSETVINQQIDTMKQLVGNPKIIVLIREVYTIPGQGKRVYGFTSNQGKVAAQLRDFMIKKSYDVVDSAKIAYGLNEAALASNPGDISNALKDKAVAAGADVLIIGDIEVNKLDLAYGQFKSYKATGNVAIHTLWGFGKILGEYNDPNQSANGAGISDLAAAQAAANRYAVGSAENPYLQPGGLAQFVHNRLSDEWGTITRNNQIVLNVKGLDASNAGFFRDDLIEKTAVKKVDERSFQGDEAVWEVIYPGRSFALADTLSFYANNPKMFNVVAKTGKSIRVLKVDRGTIQILFQ